MKRGGFLVQLGARDGQGHPPNKEPQMKPGLKVLTCVAREQGSQGWTENKDSPERLNYSRRSLVPPWAQHRGHKLVLLLSDKEPRSGG